MEPLGSGKRAQSVEPSEVYVKRLISPFALLSLGIATGCGNLGPETRARCSETSGISICLDQLVCPLDTFVGFSIENHRTRTVYQDMCYTAIHNKLGHGGTVRISDYFPDLKDVLADMRQVKPGETLRDSLWLGRPPRPDPGGASPYHFKWWVEVSMVYAKGGRLPGGLFLSRSFKVRP
jgi:hypothetical protein